MSKGKSEHQTKIKKKKWKSASPKASPFTKHHKTFHYPERDKIQFSYPIEGPKCGCLKKNSLCSTKYYYKMPHSNGNKKRSPLRKLIAKKWEFEGLNLAAT